MSLKSKNLIDWFENFRMCWFTLVTFCFFVKAKIVFLLRARLNTSVGIFKIMKFLVENGIGENFLIVFYQPICTFTISMKFFQKFFTFSSIYFIHTVIVSPLILFHSIVSIIQSVQYINKNIEFNLESIRKLTWFSSRIVSRIF